MLPTTPPGWIPGGFTFFSTNCLHTDVGRPYINAENPHAIYRVGVFCIYIFSLEHLLTTDDSDQDYDDCYHEQYVDESSDCV